MKKIVVFASGNGSNFQAIIDQLHLKVCEVALLICDNPSAYCIERAKSVGIETFVFNPKLYDKKCDYELEILSKLKKVDPSLIVLAGYMRIVSSTLLSVYEGKIINIHPALLPAFKGRDGIGDALTYGVKVMGVTVHYVDTGIDTGKIIDQASFKRAENETADESKQRIHELEHQLYPKVITQLLK